MKKITVEMPVTRKKRIRVRVDRKSGMDYETIKKTNEAISIIESFKIREN